MNTPSNPNYGGGYGRGIWGTKNSAIAAGNPPSQANTEQYNGVAWTEVGDLNTGRGQTGVSGCTTEAGVAFGGDPGELQCTEIWNGATWTEANDIITEGYSACNAGTSAEAALRFGGTGGSEEWNGVNWTEIASPPVRIRGDGTGESTEAAFGAGTHSPTNNTCVDFWNGSAWSIGAALSVGRCYLGVAGTTNDALVVGGHIHPSYTPSTEFYNGISFATTTDFPGNAGRAGGSGGTSNSSNALFQGRMHTDIYHAGSEAASGSFELLRGTVGGEIETDMFMVSGSTMKLPMFSDADLNYISQEPQESTGSMSGSVVRAGDVNILNKPGNFFFHTDYNALAFTYVSSSVYSQSIDFVTCGYQSASVYTSSTGLISQSHYCYTNVVQYITGSYT